jgi:hypothetical protein
MPLFQAAVEKTNVALSRGNIDNVDPAWFGAGQDLGMAVSLAAAANPRVGAEATLTPDEQSAIATIPVGLREAMRAAIQSALQNEGGRVPVQVLWMPGYDYEVTITWTPGIAGSIGGVSILIKSRYISDLAIRGAYDARGKPIAPNG